jgi:arsenite methyltransferase
METISTFDQKALTKAIVDEYTDLACNPNKQFHFISGKRLTEVLDYPSSLLKNIPSGAIASFAGVGNPFKMGYPKTGETVIDIGCGAGIDSLIASRFVELEGTVVGIDMTPSMIAKSKEHAYQSFALNTRFILAYAHHIPLPDHYADLIISNGVINLIPDKSLVFQEMFRLLKPGGRIQIADVLLDAPVSPLAKDRVHLWTTCVAGGLLHHEYLDLLKEAGFTHIEIRDAYPVFDDAPVASSAYKFGAKGYNIYAEKP